MADGPPDLLQQRYTHLSRQPLYALAMILPLLVFFHLSVLFVGQKHLLNLLFAHRDIVECLSFFGATGIYLPAVAVVGVLLGQHVITHHPFRLRLRVVAVMFGEAALWIVPLLALSLLVGRLTAGDSSTANGFTGVMVAVGAGIYEEFIFRLLLIELIVLMCVDVLGLSKRPVAAAAVAISAVVFSLYHPEVWTDQSLFGGPLLWRPFLFRALAGTYLSGLYLLRGFGIGVGAHVWYNLAVLVMH